MRIMKGPKGTRTTKTLRFRLRFNMSLLFFFWIGCFIRPGMERLEVVPFSGLSNSVQQAMAFEI
jgi:hypothetical protein